MPGRTTTWATRCRPGKAGRGGGLLSPGLGAEARPCRGPQQPGQRLAGPGKARRGRGLLPPGRAARIGRGSPSDRETRRIHGTSPTAARAAAAREMHGSSARRMLQLATILGRRLPDDDLPRCGSWLAEPISATTAAPPCSSAWPRRSTRGATYAAAAEQLVRSQCGPAGRLEEATADLRSRRVTGLSSATCVQRSRPSCSPAEAGSAWRPSSRCSLSGCRVPAPRWWSRSWRAIAGCSGPASCAYCDETFQSLPRPCIAATRRCNACADLDRETARVLAQRHLDRLRALDPRAARIVDKMPENYQYLGLIRVLFPQARLIHCRRDLRDVALSCWMTNLLRCPLGLRPETTSSPVSKSIRA